MRTRSLAELLAGEDRRWFEPALARLEALPQAADPRIARFFIPEAPVLVARAPGRLDVMGGIADYSGSLVLELPLARSTYAMLQARPEPRIELLSFRSDGPNFFSSDIHSLTEGALGTPDRLGEALRAERDPWAAYVLGIAQLCARLAAERKPPDVAEGHNPASGFALVLGSDVPEGAGVSSSAALEVATMAVICAHFGVELDPQGIAAACQWVENQVVGAPCGIMDQLTSVCGRADRLLRVRCQPAIVEGLVEIPSAYRFYGIDSGIRHAVSGADYGAVRTAAFMGYRMIAEVAGLATRRVGDRIEIEDPRWGGYLANLSPEELKQVEGVLPHWLSGEEFLARFGGHTDPVTRIQTDVRYPVRAATRHPVLENARVERFALLLGDLPLSPGNVAEMGGLMYESHASYTACGLGSPETDRLVEMVRAAPPSAGLFGAKITGGGSGGTVAIFGRRDAEAAVHEIARRYNEQADVFGESGPGSDQTGLLKV